LAATKTEARVQSSLVHIVGAAKISFPSVASGSLWYLDHVRTSEGLLHDLTGLSRAVLPDAPGQTLKIPMASGYNDRQNENELPHSAMPNLLPYVVDAGDAVIFDVRSGPATVQSVCMAWHGMMLM
jgi:hypothetical protein